MATPEVSIRRTTPLRSIRDSRNNRRRPRRQAKATECPECKSTSIQEHDGNTVCGDCGTSINESNIVSEVQFGENAAGAAVVQGAFVGEGQRHARGDGGRFGPTREPREVSEGNGRDEIRRQAGRHGIDGQNALVDQAISIYKLALSNNFVQGRTIASVAAVCLYAACRRGEREQQIMLIDFAEAIAVNVFKLGQTWSDMKKALFLADNNKRPVVDILDLVRRHVSKLGFGGSTERVIHDTQLLLKRMKLDWIVPGRRPNGLLGACIILAARMNNFRRTVREVVFVMKVCELTVSKRLIEFSRNPVSSMTVDQFKKYGGRLKQGEPPAIYEARMREAKKRKLAEMLEANGEDRVFDLPTLGSLNPLSASSASRQHSQSHAQPESQQPHRRDADGFAIPNPPVDPAILRESEIQSLNDHNHANDCSQVIGNNDNSQPDSPSRSPTPIGDDNASMSSRANSPDHVPGRRGWPKGKKRSVPRPQWTEEDLVSEATLHSEVDAFLKEVEQVGLQDEDIVTVTDEGEERARTAAEVGREREKNVIEAQRRTFLLEREEQRRYEAQKASAEREFRDRVRRAVSMEPTREISNDPNIAAEEFEDDPEVANCLLSEEEQKIKEKIWVNHNEDWLRTQQAKMLKRALDEAAGVGPGQQGKEGQGEGEGANGGKKEKKKRGARRVMGDGQLLQGKNVTNAADAAKLMLERHMKNPSKHINYAKVDALYKDLRGSGSRTASATPSRAGSMIREGSAGSTRATPIVLDDDEEGEQQADAGEAMQPRATTRGTATPAGRATDNADGLLTPDQTQQVAAPHATQVMSNARSSSGGSHRQLLSPDNTQQNPAQVAGDRPRDHQDPDVQQTPAEDEEQVEAPAPGEDEEIDKGLEDAEGSEEDDEYEEGEEQFDAIVAGQGIEFEDDDVDETAGYSGSEMGD